MSRSPSEGNTQAGPDNGPKGTGEAPLVAESDGTFSYLCPYAEEKVQLKTPFKITGSHANDGVKMLMADWSRRMEALGRCPANDCKKKAVVEDDWTDVMYGAFTHQHCRVCGQRWYVKLSED